MNSEFEQDFQNPEQPPNDQQSEQRSGSQKKHPSTLPQKTTPASKPPVRRVGTLTMGIALVIAGIVALIYMFYPKFDLSAVFKLSPVIFIFLGIEILFNYFFHKGERLKYDFLSGFVCFVLIVAGGIFAVAPTIWSYVGPPAMQARDRLNDEIENTVYEQLKGNGSIEAMYVNVDLPYYEAYSPDSPLQDLQSEANVYVHFTLTGSYPNPQAFAESCKSILDRIKQLPYNFRHIDFSFSNEDVRYELDVNDKFQLNMNQAGLANRVNTTNYNDSEDYNDYDDASYPDDLPESTSADDGDIVSSSLSSASSTEAA